MKYLYMGDANLSKAHCSAGYAIEPFSFDITDLVKQSKGEITVDIEKWCRGGCGWEAKIVASYQ